MAHITPQERVLLNRYEKSCAHRGKLLYRLERTMGYYKTDLEETHPHLYREIMDIVEGFTSEPIMEKESV